MLRTYLDKRTPVERQREMSRLPSNIEVPVPCEQASAQDFQSLEQRNKKLSTPIFNMSWVLLAKALAHYASTFPWQCSSTTARNVVA